MPKLPTVTAKQVISVLEKVGFEIVRQRESHVRLKHTDSRVVTIPVHLGRNLGKGLLRKIF
ncbi:MAG: type II toxin-antitoxin system HicA family toxin [Crocosphaera sp.]|nr:type II toxin-antitoxin system HicA family toxin [Crocosphaera sp.]